MRGQFRRASCGHSHTANGGYLAYPQFDRSRRSANYEKINKESNIPIHNLNASKTHLIVEANEREET